MVLLKSKVMLKFDGLSEAESKIRSDVIASVFGFNKVQSRCQDTARLAYFYGREEINGELELRGFKNNDDSE